MIVEDALMIEPTDTETRETLDEFAEALIKILEEAGSHPEILKMHHILLPYQDLMKYKPPEIQIRDGGSRGEQPFATTTMI